MLNFFFIDAFRLIHLIHPYCYGFTINIFISLDLGETAHYACIREDIKITIIHTQLPGFTCITTVFYERNFSWYFELQICIIICLHIFFSNSPKIPSE